MSSINSYNKSDVDNAEKELRVSRNIEQFKLLLIVDSHHQEQQLNDAARNLSSRLAQLIAASQSTDRQHVGASASDAGHSLRNFVHKVADVAPAAKIDSLVNGARSVVQGSGRVFGDVRSSAPYPQLKQSLDHVNESIRQTLASLPEQASLGDAIQRIQRYFTCH